MPSSNFKHINAAEQIFDGSITTSLLANGSVTAAKLAIGAITSSSITIDSPINFNNFPVENFRIENVIINPLPGEAGRLIWNSVLNEFLIDVELPITITSISNASFNVITVVDGTHLVVSSTAGIIALDAIVQGANTTTVTTVTNGTDLVVADTTGFVGQGITSVPFEVITVTDPTHLVVDHTTGMLPGYTITQGINSTTITSVTDFTHLVVVDTTGWVGGPTGAIALVPFNVIAVPDATHLTVSNTLGMGPGDITVQGLNSTSIDLLGGVIDSTHLVVADTTGWASNAATDRTLTVSDTTGVIAGMYLDQGVTISLITGVLDATHLNMVSTVGFVVGPAHIGFFTPMLLASSILGTPDEIIATTNLLTGIEIGR